jgi:hypothetical protein
MITKQDIDLISKLDTYKYSKTMAGIVSDDEKKRFDEIKLKMRELAEEYFTKLEEIYYLTDYDVSGGNPINFHGGLRRVWSGLFKGSANKQYAAQISFVINTQKKCLDVGFYFGRASGFNYDKATRNQLEAELKQLGQHLYTNIEDNGNLNVVFNDLFENGFVAEIEDTQCTSQQWLEHINEYCRHSSIRQNIYPNELGYVDPVAIDLCVSMVLPLIAILPNSIANVDDNTISIAAPLTPEQRAKQAERRALIGADGEKFAMQFELDRLKKTGISLVPKHVSLISDNYGYDIESYASDGSKIFIEVKTTTLTIDDPMAQVFYMSLNEINVYEGNKDKYKLYRVYNIYGTPSLVVIDLDAVTREIRNYKMIIT